MIKKVGSNAPTKIATTGVDSIKGAKVEGVTDVNKSSATNKFKAITREITPDLKKQLLEMIEDEAEKILAGDGISEKRKSKVKNALKMALEAGNNPEEET